MAQISKETRPLGSNVQLTFAPETLGVPTGSFGRYNSLHADWLLASPLPLLCQAAFKAA
jgi:hypothetical protein